MLLPKMLPNILITGTPGVGKSRLAKELVERLDNRYKWHNVSQVAKDNDCVSEHDEEYDCPVLNEDKLLDFLEPQICRGGNIVEYHGCEFFPKRWFHLVFVVQCDNTILYDRLKKRNYKEKKIRENIECEIFQTILEEARDNYDESIIHTFRNENSEDRTAALEKMAALVAEEELDVRDVAKNADDSDPDEYEQESESEDDDIDESEDD